MRASVYTHMQDGGRGIGQGSGVGWSEVVVVVVWVCRQCVEIYVGGMVGDEQVMLYAPGRTGAKHTASLEVLTCAGLARSHLPS